MEKSHTLFHRLIVIVLLSLSCMSVVQAKEPERDPSFQNLTRASGDAISDRVQIEGRVDTSQSGTYPLTYSLLKSLGDTPTATNSLLPGDRMLVGESLYSTNGEIRLVLQGDTNLVIYDGVGRALWASGTVGSGADRLQFQGDGNLVLYAGSRAVWSSRTHGNTVDRLVLNNNGSLVIYNGNDVVWYAGNEPPTDDDNGNSDIQYMGATSDYDGRDKLNIDFPSATKDGDLLVLALSRTDDLLPIELSGWTAAASCFKSTNGQRDCFEIPDCIDQDGDYCLRFDGGRGRDLATVIFYKTFNAGDNRDLSLNLRGSKPSWAIISTIRGAYNANPIGDVATESNDGSSDSLFPSVYGESGDMLLLSMAFDDTTQRNDFRAPDGMEMYQWIAGPDEAGYVYGQVLTRNGETGSKKTRGDGGSRAKDALISVIIRGQQ